MAIKEIVELVFLGIWFLFCLGLVAVVIREMLK